MNTAEIARQLTNAGINVLGADATHIYIEDPACIMRGFQTFLGYAWTIIATITAILLFGWAIALLRGSKNNVPTNIRNLLLMFGALSAVGPIVGIIYGEDIFARGCRRIGVDIAGVRQVMDARNKNMRGDNGELYEVFEIRDTGAIVPENLDAVSDMPDESEAGHIEQTFEPGASSISSPGGGTPSTHTDTGDNAGTPSPGTPAPTTSTTATTTSGTRQAVSAVADGSDVIYTRGDNSRVRFTSGTRAWRNTNPGNIRYSEFSRNAGAIGTAGGFAVFPTEAVGQQAIVSLLQSDSYRNLTIIDAISRYAPPFENDTAAYHKKISKMTGLDVKRKISSLTPAEVHSVANAIRRIEGWRAGRQIELDKGK